MLDFLFSAWPLLLALSVVLTSVSVGLTQWELMDLNKKYRDVEDLKEKYLDLMRIMVAETKLNQR